MKLDPHQADLLIVGGGVLGAFHAYHALRRGLKVLLLERNSIPRGASVRNFGQVVPSGLDDRWQLFGRASLRIYEELQSEIELSVRRQGSIYIASDEDEMTLIEELHTINSANDYPSERLNSHQCLDRYPHLRPGYCKGGLYFPDEISINPRTMLQQLHRYLSGQPNFISIFNTCVCGLESDSNSTVIAETSCGKTFVAEKALICCGSEFRLLFPELFLASKIKMVRLQMLRLSPQPHVVLPGNILTGLSIRRYESFAQCPSWTSIKSRETSAGFAKQWGVHILFKQEADGGIILGDSHEYAPIARQDELNFDLRYDINEFFISEGRKIFDLPSWTIESAWQGRYSETDDPKGIYLQTIDDNIHIATAIGGKGMTSSAGFADQNLREIYND